MTLEDLTAEDSDAEDQLPPRPTSKGKGAAAPGEPTGIHKFSRKLKDKITGQTHTEREQARARRAEQERQAYLQHLRTRQALIRAMETGQPQLLGKDRQGRDVYIEPPHGPYAPRGAYGYNPYSSGIQAYGICVQLDRTVGRMDTAMEEELGYPSQLVSLVAPCLVVRCSKGLMVTIPDNRCHWLSTCPSL